jgi:hypothetical protein
MKTLQNQTIYKCEFCNKRFVTKSGAKLHEERYCRKNYIKQESCEHKNTYTVWAPIVGEANREEPDYDYCPDCHLKF